jgi:hypothetical protein
MSGPASLAFAAAQRAVQSALTPARTDDHHDAVTLAALIVTMMAEAGMQKVTPFARAEAMALALASFAHRAAGGSESAALALIRSINAVALTELMKLGARDAYAARQIERREDQGS